MSQSYEIMALDAAMATDAAQHSARSLRVDLDLTELKSDSRVGILRLARDLVTPPKGFIWKDSKGRASLLANGDDPLDQFMTAAILVAGQEYAALLPPITHDGQAVVSAQLSPDGLTLLTLGKDFTARLWDARTAQPIAILRRGNERVVNCGVSPDGRTAFTDDQTSIARFWDVPSGRFRAAIEIRPNRYVGSESAPAEVVNGSASYVVKLGDSRLLTKRCVNANRDENVIVDYKWEGPVELWDATSGRLVTRLDAPGHDIRAFQMVEGGQWVTTSKGNTVLVFSAEDGKLAARLKLPDGERLNSVAASPSGRKLATVVYAVNDNNSPYRIHIWDTGTWRIDSTQPATLGSAAVKYWTEELMGQDAGPEGLAGLNAIGHIYRLGQPVSSLDISGHTCLPLMPEGDFLLVDDGIIDSKTGDRLVPPTGKRFHPMLSRFAADGRFVVTKNSVMDVRTEKAFPIDEWPGFDYRCVPGFGFDATIGTELRLFPTAALKDIPAELLELWAQVAVRGELSSDGQFVKWNEQTWDQKRQKLAVATAPIQGLPFPGYVATDKLHWLRLQFDEAKTDQDKLRIARDLLQRSELAGDRIESARWKSEVSRLARQPAKLRW